MPRYALLKDPVCFICLTIGLAELIGMAKPMPSPELALAELIPTTWPYLFTRGPPELPELMVASVWSSPSMVVADMEEDPDDTSMVLSRPEIMPWLMENLNWSPRGLPKAAA